ncbi:MAG: ChbG/HpnK family deacetylase [candidate division FCPU426 bacterium]
MQKQLLLTSDDFGMCHSVNTGIVRAMTEGMVRSTNFLAPAPWFYEAAELAKKRKLQVGVHLCLTCDWDRLKWGPITAGKSLRNEHGHFYATHAALEPHAKDDEMFDELRAQILRVKAVYGEPSHLDTHMIGGEGDNGGIRSRTQAIVKQLSREFGLAYTYERDASGRLIHFNAEECQSLMDSAGIFKILESWTEPGRYHLYGHAAEDSAELEAICTPQHPSRVWAQECRVRDLAFYLNPSNLAHIKSLGFELMTVDALKP